MKFKTVVILISILLIVLFSVQNSEITEVNFLFWKLSISRVLIILGSFAIGIVVGVLLSLKRKFFNNSNKNF